jgi:putative oxidoreductase
VHAAAAGAAETGGGALIALGLATPLGASLLSGTMITAIRKVHAAKGPWASDGGYEYNLVLLAIVFALSDVGPGRLSLDHALGRERKGLSWAIAQLAAGAIGSTVAIQVGERQSAAAQGSAGVTGETGAANGTVQDIADTAAA